MADLLRYLGDGRDLPDQRLPEGLGEKELLDLYRWLVILRTFDERAVNLQRQGRVGTYPMYWGEEGTQAGALYACEETDWVFPSYRQCAIGLLRGISAARILGWVRGYGGPAGFYNPREFRVGPICVPIGTHLPHATGVAWAAKIMGERTASLVWFGDGATSEGDFHEGVNFASVFKTATVFFCTNNQWAISTPVTRQMGTKTVAEKAAAYGIPGVRVDGFDPIACWKATRDALDRGRAGGGPTLIEAFCYRLKAHGTADDPSLYRDEAESQRWIHLEPVGRMAGFLRRENILDEDKDAAIRQEAKDMVAEGVRGLESMDLPGPEVMFDHVYASGRPWTYEEQLDEVTSVARQEPAAPPAPPAAPTAGDPPVSRETP
jgi:pyruvate dehydrogenase E1 component alpha subunit